MKTYKALIIEDEAPARDLIRHYLKNHPRIELIGQCQDGFEGIKAISGLSPDIIFLDIQMPRISGFEMLELLEEGKIPVTIFTTAFDQFAIKAFEYSALDYLLKPISRERFDQAINKALEKLSTESSSENEITKAIDAGIKGEQYLSRIVIKSGAGIHVIAQEDILFIEAMDDYVLIYTSSGEEFLKKKTLKYYQQNLDPGRFLRVHRSCIVAINAINKIEAYSKDAWIGILHNGRKVPVSKAGYSALRKTFDF